MRTNKMNRDIDLFFEIVKTSYSVTEVARRLGYKPSGGTHKFLKLKFKEYKLDTSHFNGRGWSIGKTRENDKRVNSFAEKMDRKWEDIFKKDSNVKNYILLRRLVSEGKRKYKCCICNISKWNEKPLRLHLHHVNGDSLDNREDNLDLICPNCHTQTKNYSRGTKRHRSDSFNRWWINMSLDL